MFYMSRFIIRKNPENKKKKEKEKLTNNENNNFDEMVRYFYNYYMRNRTLQVV